MDTTRVFLGNDALHWLSAIGTAAVVWLVLQILKAVAVKRLGKLAEATETKIDDLAIALLARTRFFFLMYIGIYFGARLLYIPPKLEPFWHDLFVVVIALQAIAWGNCVIGFLFGKNRQVGDLQPAANATYGILGFVAKLLLWSAVLLLTLSNFGVNITAIVTGLGVGGIAVALAAQKILGDIFSSFIIVFDKPFEVGDFIVIDTFQGKVEHVGIKTTRLRSITGEQIVMPNSTVIDSKLRNYKRMEERRVVFRFQVEYTTPHEKLSKLPDDLKNLIESMEPVRFEAATLIELAASGIVYEVIYYVLESDFKLYLALQQKLNLSIVAMLEKEQVRFAYPTQTVFVQNNTR